MLQRLFVAIPLPHDIIAALVSIAPSGRGIRAVAPDQMHLTLHFLGDAEAKRAIDALQGIAARAFELAVAGVGSFRAAGGAILWAGLAEAQAPRDLHAALAAALSAAGLRVERRPFHPHVTIARCRADAARDAIAAFLQRHRDLRLPPFAVTRYTLFSSSPGPRGMGHRVEHEWPLSAGQTDGRT